MIGQLGADGQEDGFASRSIVVNSGVHERTRVIDLVLPELKAAVQTPFMAGLIKLRIRIDVAVRTFCRGGRDAGDIPIEPRFKFRIRMDDKEVCRAANHLVNETVVPGRTGMAA